jgi:serine/threonine protein kinase
MMPDFGERLAAELAHLEALAPAERSRYLDALHETDPALADRLRAMLHRPASGPEELTARELRVAPRGPVDGRATSSFSSPEAAPPAEGPGTRTGLQILGRYQLLAVVGSGAFGEVWKAFDPVLDKHVAVKTARPGRAAPVGAFLDEARAAAAVRHPAIVHVYDVAANPDGWYIISEFIDGESLRTQMEAGRLPIQRAVRVVATVAGALHAAHLAGIFHRDVKPGNILLDRAGNAYLTDFGLAVREENQFAERSKVSGTLAYMPPEQIRGDNHLLDGRADIYALGAVLYELLTGRPVFRATEYGEYRELILRREPRPLRAVDPTVPEELERICLKCLAKDVKDRYRTARDLANDLEAWLADSTRTFERGTEPGGKSGRRPALLLAGAVVALVAGAVAVSMRGGNTAPTRPDPDGGSVGIKPDPKPVVAQVQKVPTVKELWWTSRNPIDKWEILNDHQLRVSTGFSALLQLGETDPEKRPEDANWSFTVTLSQVQMMTGIGVFLGHRLNPETRTANYEMIRLVVINGQPQIQRATDDYHLEKPFILPHHWGRAGATPQNLMTQNTYRIVVTNNVLSEVQVNGQSLPTLLKGFRFPASGGFGLIVETSQCVLSDPQFNDNKISLFVDPTR